MSLAYFPLFPADFEADTAHLSFAEDGAYNRLLRLAWRCPEAKMPDDLDWICRKARATTTEDRALIAAILDEFFSRERGKIFQKKLTNIWSDAHARHDKRVAAGRVGGAAKALKFKDVRPSNATAMPEQCSSNHNHNHNQIKRSVSPDGDTPRLALEAFNEAASRVGWPQVRTMTKARSAALGARIKDAGGLEGWLAAIRRAEASDFLTGKTDKAFRLTFDFLTREASFAKLAEGNYDNRQKEVPRQRVIPLPSEQERLRNEELFRHQLERARAERGH